MEKTNNLRNIVLTMLAETLENSRFSHVVLNETFSSYDLSAQERKFITVLYTGTLEKLIFLDHVIDSFSKKGNGKIKPVIRNILRMGVYQILFMDSVPDRAAVSESLKLCQKRRLDGLKPFVNGMLRSIARSKEQIISEQDELPLHIRYSVPEWIVNRAEKQYGREKVITYLKAVNAHDGKVTVRLTGNDGDFRNETLDMLKTEGCSIERIPGLDDVVKIYGFDSLTGLKAFETGRIFVQDISSVLAVKVITEEDVFGKDTPLIIDVCAAPGGKSLALADRFPEAKIISMDISEKKTALIEENIRRLHIDNVETYVHDSLSADSGLFEKADAVICDLPCSGLGVIGNKPDIRYRLKESDINELAGIQRKMLKESASYVKPGGVLVFSTCTISKEENADNAVWFEENTDFISEPVKDHIPAELLTDEQREEKENWLQLLNGVNDMDGFFISKFRRK